MTSSLDENFTFVVFTEPKAKKRPKVYRWSTVNPSKEDEDILRRLVARLENCPKYPLDGQIRLKLKFYKIPPKSMPKWKHKLIEKDHIRPSTSPDLDNYVKLVLDSLNGLIWTDDRVINEIHAAKFYTLEQPRIEIYVHVVPIIKNKKSLDGMNLDLQDRQPLDEFF